jgi:predicted DCC family thiol-disulfide oxidoreductase YuxK
LLYDGVCGLCNGVVRFVLRRDREARFRFASLQGPVGRSLLARFGKDATNLDTIYVLVNRHAASPVLLDRSRAALFVLACLGAPWSWLQVAGVLPDAVLDRVYDAIARRRYRWFGRHDACPLPEPEWADRFVDD